MTNKPQDGGAAFPTTPENHTMSGSGKPGMSLRDWFAGMAAAGHLASLNPGSWGNDKALAEDTAKGAYLVADALLTERSKP